MRNKIKSLCKSKKGNVLVTIIGRVIFTAIILIFVLETLSIVIHKQHIDYISKTLATVIEQDGYVSSDVDAYLYDLNRTLGTNATYEVSFDDGIYRGGADVPSRAIQFRDKFTIIVKDVHTWTVATPLNSQRDITVDIPIVSDVSGRSEVYWK